MFQLILTIMAIALFAGLTVVTVNYLPAWAPAAHSLKANSRARHL